MRVVFACPFAITSMLGALTPAFADSVSDCQWATDDPKVVIEACSVVLSDKAAKPWMYFNRGLAFKLLGELDEASSDYSKAIELDPSYAAAYANRGNVRLLRNDVVGALADYRMAIKLDPNDQIARQNLKAVEKALRKVGAKKSGSGVKTGPVP
jgi:tetratricopeptide (TPR) repeat protein